MSPDNNIDDISDEPPDNPSDRSRGLLEQLRAIIEALAEIEEEEGGHRRESGRTNRGSTRIDYDYNVSIGLGSEEGTASSRDQLVSDRSQTDGTRSQRGDEDSVHIETRKITNDELVVIADLPGDIDEELDINLDTDKPALELRTNEELVGRVALDHPDVTINDVTLNNQILEIRLNRTSGSKEGESK